MFDPTPYLWLIPTLPLAAAALVAVLGPKFLREQSHLPVLLAAAGSCVLSVFVLLHVANLEKGVQFYRILYGKEAVREGSPERVWFQIGNTRLGLQQAPAGQKPRIDHFGIKVAAFDRTRVTEGLQKLGAQVIASPEEPGVLRFRDLDGITLEIRAS